MKKWFPWIITVLMAAWVLSTLRSPSPKAGFDVAAFGRLPVLLEGRIQPIDSVARNTLLQIRTKQAVVLEDGRKLSATEWLLEATMKPESSDAMKVFRIDHDELLSLLKLPVDQKYFSFEELRPQFEELDRQANRIEKIESQKQSTFEKALLRLQNGLWLYHRLKNSFEVENTENFAADVAAYSKSVKAGTEAFRAQQAGKDHDKALLEKFTTFLQKYDDMSREAYPMIIPPLKEEKGREGWANIGSSLVEIAHATSEELHPAIKGYAAMCSAYRAGNAAEFSQALTQYSQWLAANQPKAVQKGRLEFLFNQFQPFYNATVLYVLAFLLAAFSLLNMTEWLRRGAFNLMALAFVVHSAGLIFRMALEGRPPVTNLYSSAVFIGWGAVMLGLCLEHYFPYAITLLVASLTGFITQIIAHNLALGGDTMQMLRAVLDTNFWLATHVVTITMGYSATFFAGSVAVCYILMGALTRNLTPKMADTLEKIVYGVTCFAAFFNFLGTVLGGIWADQSWGRFWGWDPKENGALVIVLFNAIFLHVRASGFLQARSLMGLAVFGNIVTAWSWFGVNMLGVGLHAYGFMDSAMKWLMIFVATQLIIIIAGVIPKQYWRSR